MLANENDAHEVTTNGGDDDTLTFHMRLKQFDPECDMRIDAHWLGDRRALGVTQELDMLGVLARIGHPAATCSIQSSSGCGSVVVEDPT